MSKPRKYTGNKDPHPKARPGTKRFQDYMVFLFGMDNWGIYSNRKVRGSGKANPPLSVHATGRACDLAGTPEKVKAAIDFLYAFRDADHLDIEEIHDYRNVWIPGNGFGAGYRCDRDNGGLFSGWRVYTKNTIGAGGNWVHYEVAPALADNPAKVDAAFKKVLDKIVAAMSAK